MEKSVVPRAIYGGADVSVRVHGTPQVILEESGNELGVMEWLAVDSYQSTIQEKQAGNVSIDAGSLRSAESLPHYGIAKGGCERP
jgi:hypothetical protein